MAICDGCGAASTEGAMRCAACGRSFAIGEVEFGGGGLSAPQGQGSWGAGVVVEARPKPAVLRWFTDADWRPAMRVVAAPTGLLLVAALLLALGLAGGDAEPLGFGTRFGIALALVLAAFGAPVGMDSEIGRLELVPDLTTRFQFLPMTVTLLWIVLFRYGLRAARRSVLPEFSARRRAAEAGRPVLLAVLVNLMLGLLARAEPSPGRAGRQGPVSWLFQVGYADHAVVSLGVVRVVLGSVVLAGATAAAVYGAEVLRRVAGAWVESARAAVRALLSAVAVAAAAAVVVLAVREPSEVVLPALVLLPNLGLLLLGFGSGATFGAGFEHSGPAGFDLRSSPGYDVSLVDLGGLGGQWRWTVLLALAGALLFGWTVRTLGLAGRLRAAALYWAGASLLMVLAGYVQQIGFQLRGSGNPGEVAGMTSTTTLGLGLVSVLVANLLWAALGAVAVPLLFGRWGGRAAPSAAPADAPSDHLPAGVPPRPAYAPFTDEVLDSNGPR
ncbi:hypothetical protein KCMC57_up39520 [Kitasatospora sp. CMC57]|uniref:Zinc ribbon domain-containing protein n=1 Tax=Kitasatospora sp. CMC57 TaxID=3231513 RepID=A0AB33K824_9ACTN